LNDRLPILAAASMAGVAGGLTAGILARLTMRLVVLLRGDTPEFSLPGTAGILLTFVAMGGALAVLYSLRRTAAPR